MSVSTVEAVVVVGRALLATSACLDWPEMVNCYNDSAPVLGEEKYTRLDGCGLLEQGYCTQDVCAQKSKIANVILVPGDGNSEPKFPLCCRCCLKTKTRTLLVNSASSGDAQQKYPC